MTEKSRFVVVTFYGDVQAAQAAVLEAVRPLMIDYHIQGDGFMTVRFPAKDLRTIHDAIDKAMVKVQAGLVTVSTNGRHPQPDVPQDSAAHAATLRTAGHVDAAAHLEHIAAIHARSRAELVAAQDKLVHGMPPDVCKPGLPVHEYADTLLGEWKRALQDASTAKEATAALAFIEELCRSRPETTLAEILATIEAARRKAAARVARIESAKRRAGNDVTSPGT